MSRARRAFLTLPTEPPATEGADAWGQLYRRAQGDAAFKARLVAEPAATLAEAGIEAPAGVQVEVVEATDTEGYLLLPPMPEGLDSETLDDDVAGYFSCAVAPTPPPAPPLLPPSNMLGPRGVTWNKAYMEFYAESARNMNAGHSSYGDIYLR